MTNNAPPSLEILLTVASVCEFSDTLFELTLRSNGMPFEPGDCLSLFDGTGEVSHPYSIASGTREDKLRFLIRRLPKGRISGYLAHLRPGDRVRVSEPFGWFRPGQTDEDPFVFIATGTGVAPFLSYLRSFPHRPPLQCLWGVRYVAEAQYAEEVARICDLSLAVSRETSPAHYHGRVTGLLNDLPKAQWPHYFLCGSEAMISETTGMLERQGCPITKIHREVFFYERSVD